MSIIGVATTDLPLKLVGRGKVRDIYELSDGKLLMVTTDRVSAFDVVMNQIVPGRGVILNQISIWWKYELAEILGIKHDIVSTQPWDIYPELVPFKEQLKGRAVVVYKTKPLPIECIVRGYLTGSGLKDYNSTGKVCGHELPSGLVDGSKLETALFTPSTKADLGLHDENITLAQAIEMTGQETFDKVQEMALAIYTQAREYAAERGIIIADTKFEFGKLPDGTIVLIDEVLTPDSSRFWSADQYKPGQSQPSFDKQVLRDHLSELKKQGSWNGEAPAPHLPVEIIQSIQDGYIKAYQIITGQNISLPLVA